MPRHHWLVSVLERSGQPTRDIHLPADLEPEVAWDEACQAVRGLTAARLADLVAEHFRLDVADLDAAEAGALRLVPHRTLREHLVYPLREDYRRLVVATSDPTDTGAEQAVSFASGRRVVFEVAAPADIQQRLAETSGDDWALQSLIRSFDDDGLEPIHVVADTGPQKVGSSEIETEPVIRITDQILAAAIAQEASDIHIGPGPQGGAVRLRVDGVLRTVMRIPLPALNRVVSRIKVLGELDIADRLRPQDGRARVRARGRTYDLRISTVPTRGTEKVVIRILDPASTRSLADIGLPADALGSLRRLLNNREGVLIVTGATGSGKTTTLYACLKEVSGLDIHVMTAEDPVEYDLPGATQIEINERQGVTFPSALRAMLRQDPDVILVGEVRDRETGEMALRASMTGHLVLTTLHANDAPGAVPRLVDIGLEPAMVAATLRGVVAQRLIRRVCSQCAVPVEGGPTPEEEALEELYGVAQSVRAVGCRACAGTGYRGRTPLVEVLAISDRASELIAEGATHAELRRRALQDRMVPMLSRAQELVREGRTTLEELGRILGEDVEEAGEEPQAPPVVLLVDDDQVVRSVARVVLESAGFQVVEAADGLKALTRLDSDEDFALVVLDLEMPRMGGEDTLQRIRAAPGTAALPVVVLTGAEGGEAEKRVLALGADDYIRKPVDPAQFIARVKGVLARSGLTPIARED